MSFPRPLGSYPSDCTGRSSACGIAGLVATSTHGAMIMSELNQVSSEQRRNGSVGASKKVRRVTKMSRNHVSYFRQQQAGYWAEIAGVSVLASFVLRFCQSDTRFCKNRASTHFCSISS